ncbi:MAG: matrixin family metalloprotease [Candidatus Aminicenantia bacterium]
MAVSIASALPSNKGIEKAKKVSPAIDESTGELRAPPEFVAELPESKLTKVVFIRYAPGFQKDKPCNNDGVCDPDEKGWCGDCKGGGEEEPPTTVCYGFLANSKPRWNWIENYYYSDSGLGTLSASTVSNWESVPNTRDIFGSGTFGAFPWGVYDYKNSIIYGDYPEAGVIAVTATWFRGKNIYEYDILFDTDYFPGTGAIDLDTVVLHEFGHGGGLDDLDDPACVSEVMYGVYDGVDLDLGPGDTIGIQTLYGI